MESQHIGHGLDLELPMRLCHPVGWLMLMSYQDLHVSVVDGGVPASKEQGGCLGDEQKVPSRALARPAQLGIEETTRPARGTRHHPCAESVVSEKRVESSSALHALTICFCEIDPFARRALARPIFAILKPTGQ